MKKFRTKKKSVFGKATHVFSLENRAQSGAVFRLMIDSIIGLAILLVIISILAYFNALRIQAAQGKFFSLVTSATNSPNGKVFSENNLLFTPSGLSTITIRNKTNIYEGCFHFESNLTNVKISDLGSGEASKIDFTSNVETNVYAKCVLNGDQCDPEDEECCEVDCTISFGKKLLSDES